MSGAIWPLDATGQSALLASNWLLFAVAGFCVAVLVWGLLLFALIRWRRTSPVASTPPQFRNNYALEITWTALPLVLVCALFVQTYRVESAVEAVTAHPDVRIAVDAYRWGWRFTYANGPTIAGGAPSYSGPSGVPPQMVIPLDETTQIDLTSSDVTHSFFVPDFLFKRDAIPGMVNTFDLRPTKLGTFVGRCTQFCGLDHALMTFSVRVVEPADYARWLRQQPRA